MSQHIFDVDREGNGRTQTAADIKLLPISDCCRRSKTQIRGRVAPSDGCRVASGSIPAQVRDKASQIYVTPIGDNVRPGHRVRHRQGKHRWLARRTSGIPWYPSCAGRKHASPAEHAVLSTLLRFHWLSCSSALPRQREIVTCVE